MKRRVELTQSPQRIVSLVPSQSEFLYDIGLHKELVGISKFCIHPENMFASVTKVGGTKQLNLDKIRALKPDLIIGNKEENERAQIEELTKEFCVWMSDINTLDDAFEMMSDLGKMCNRVKETEKLLNDINEELETIRNYLADKSALYFIWNEPYMAVGANTFINSVLKWTGISNCAGHLERYPALDAEELKRLNPQYCLLSSEPYPFKEKHCKELKQILPDSKIILVDGEMFSWYGSRLQRLPSYIKELASCF